MKARYQSDESVIAWQKTPPWQQHTTRAMRAMLTFPLYLSQLPFIALDVAFGTTYYGRRSWSFSFRALRLLAAYAAWSLNPGTRPLDDVLSKEARGKFGKLKKGQHAALIEVPPCPEKLFGDAVYNGISPESCPCFWQWLSTLPDPRTDTTPMKERKVMLYFVGGGMVQGHPLNTPLPWNVMEASQIPILGVNFRKCVTKKTAFPAAIQDGVAAFEYLLKLGFLPENMSIIGDSGGGGIVVTLLLYLSRHGLPTPANAILVSPFVTLVDKFMASSEQLNLDALNPGKGLLFNSPGTL